MKIGEHGDITPEVLKANIDDVSAWTFNGAKQNDVFMLSQGTDSDGRNECDVNELDVETLSGEVVKPRSVSYETSSDIHLQ